MKKTLTPDVAKRLYLAVPHELRNKLLWLPDNIRNMGIHFEAGRGTGKSRLMGRVIAFTDFLRGIPTIILDPHGSTIDNFLDKILRLPRILQKWLLSRILYVDMSGINGFIHSLPLYYRLGNESLFVISQRPLDVIRKLDPNLQTASIEGWNALWRTGTYTGMVLAARGYQITEAERLLNNPQRWDFSEVLASYPETQSAISYFRELGEVSKQVHSRRTESFYNKVALFSLDPPTKAMFGAAEPSVNWDQVVKEGLIVLLDFRHEHNIESRKFKMAWAFNYLLDFIKHRGVGRHKPISLIIDEITSLFSVQAMNGEIFASELDELINVIARNYMVWLTIAHQELFQLPEKVQKTLMSMGTQILGSTSDRDTAILLAHQFFHFNPNLVRKYEPIYMNDMGSAFVVDHRSVEFTADEQDLLRSYAFSDQGRFQFLVATPSMEGGARKELRQISLASIDPGIYPQAEPLAKARELLMKRRGLPIKKVLAEIDDRLKPKVLRESRRRKRIKKGRSKRTKGRSSIWSK